VGELRERVRKIGRGGEGKRGSKAQERRVRGRGGGKRHGRGKV